MWPVTRLLLTWHWQSFVAEFLVLILWHELVVYNWGITAEGTSLDIEVEADAYITNLQHLAVEAALLDSCTCCIFGIYFLLL